MKDTKDMTPCELAKHNNAKQLFLIQTHGEDVFISEPMPDDWSLAKRQLFHGMLFNVIQTKDGREVVCATPFKGGLTSTSKTYLDVCINIYKGHLSLFNVNFHTRGKYICSYEYRPQVGMPHSIPMNAEGAKKTIAAVTKAIFKVITEKNAKTELKHMLDIAFGLTPARA